MSRLSKRGAAITAIGSYVPERIMTNDDLSRLVDTNDDWIVRRTGIRERRISAPEQFTSDMCVSAVQSMLQSYPVQLDDVELIIVCTHTPDMPFPSAASQVQHKLAIPHAGTFDLNSTCAGFVYGLHVAHGLIAAGIHRKILVFAADTMSKITDYSDRGTCILFGDGAGVVLVERCEHAEGLLGGYVVSDGSGGAHVYRTGLSDRLNGLPLEGSGHIVQNGREVYKWAAATVPDGMRKTVESAELGLHQIDWFVPHSANIRMIESICERSGFPIEKTLTSLEYFGNTSAASIPLSLHKAVQEKKLQQDDLLLLYGFGSGLVQAGIIVRWLA